MAFTARDATNLLTRALPNGANTVTSTSLDTRNSTRGDFTAHAELEITAPALTTSQLANAATITYNVIGSTNADLSSPVKLGDAVLVQTGAGGNGAAAAKKRFRLPTNTPRYVGIQATNSGSGNASTVSATLALLT
jgi:hypothetical protein